MLDKYIKINDKQILAGQTAAGVWYCKELPANTTTELNALMGEVNKILNEHNVAKPPKDKKEK